MTIKDILVNLFGQSGRRGGERSVTLNVVGRQETVRDYVNAIKTDRRLAREIYHNVNKNYALAGQLVKPIINNNANFIGIPTLFGNKKALKVLADTKIDYRKIHKSIEIDGDIFIWPQWDSKKETIKLVTVPVDVVDSIYLDPITKEVYGYKLIEKVQYNTPDADFQEITIVCIVTAEKVIRKVTGSKNYVLEQKNPFGVLPIVHFSNDKDISEQYGHSEIESVEPQLRFYHELTYEAGAAQSRDGHPKLKVKTKNARQWVNNNFGAGSFEAIQAGQGTLSLDDRDLFINTDDDDVNYLYLNKTSGDYTKLSETTFTNIVEGSETPEINFGANIGTSLASVKEYRPVWIKKIEAKQFERTEPWLEVYAIILSIYNFVHLKNIVNDITITWPKPNFASVKEQAEIVQAFANAIEKLQAAGAISKEEVYNTLKKLDIFDLLKTFEEQQSAIETEMPKEETKDNDKDKEVDDENTVE